MLGNLGPLGPITCSGRVAVGAFWEYIAFASNSFVFLLVGMREARQNFYSAWRVVLLAIALVTLSRAAAVYACCGAFSRSAWRVSGRHQHVLCWGGLRGALALALALPGEMPQRDLIVTTTFAVVAFSVYVQGLTITSLLRRFGEIPS
jgi:CPA1 family monovalent cation:H+ antiporter